jgi:hypothetical protein
MIFFLKLNGNHLVTLVSIFPTIFMQLSLFTEIFFRSTKSPWRDPSIRRQFFEDYAKKNNFDPLIPENWRKKIPKMQDLKVCSGLYDVFTDILCQRT